MTAHKSAPRNALVLPVLLLASLILNGIFLWQNWRRNMVIAVPDGDSVQMADGRRVRLMGINAPERDRCMGNEASSFLRSVAAGKHVRLKNEVTDDYGRIVANVIIEDLPTWLTYLRWRYLSRPATTTFVQGWTLHSPAFPDPDPLLNRALVSRGLAQYTSVRSEYTDTLKSAEAYAQENNLGIWSAGCRQTEPPDPACAIKGNVRAGKKTYILPDCKNYGQTIIDLSYGDQWFCTEKEAKEAGFTRSPTCPK